LAFITISKLVTHSFISQSKGLDLIGYLIDSVYVL